MEMETNAQTTIPHRQWRTSRAGIVYQEAHLPQRDSASATHVFLGSLYDRAIHWTRHLVEQLYTVSQKSMWRYLFEHNSNINCPII